MIANRIFIVEDNFIHREHVSKLVQQFSEQSQIQYQQELISNFTEFGKQISAETIRDTDIYILDIELNSFFSGLDLAEMIRKSNPKCYLLFLTSLESKSIEAINRGSAPFAYLVKNPVDEAILNQKLSQVLLDINAELTSETDASIFIKDGLNLRKLNYSELLYFETVVGNRYSTIIETIDDTILVGGTLASFKKKLQEETIFLTSLKSYIINISLIKEFDAYSDTIKFTNNKELHLSPKIMRKVKQYIKEGGNVL